MATYAYTFTSGDTVTPTKLNDARTVSEIVNADIKSDAAIAGSKLGTDISPSKLTGSGYVYVNTLYYTTTGTHTFSKATYPYLRAVVVKCQGAGGGGGGAAATVASQNAIGGGGGGGSYAEKLITDISGMAASVTITVGAGGAGGVGNANGAAGGNSSFGSEVIGNGGAAGEASGIASAVGTFKVGSAGATSGTGDIVIAGRSAETAQYVLAASAVSANGGDSFLGAGGFRAANGAGAAGVRGGGGSGAANQQSQSAKDGGAGGNGIVIVELYA